MNAMWIGAAVSKHNIIILKNSERVRGLYFSRAPWTIMLLTEVHVKWTALIRKILPGSHIKKPVFFPGYTAK